MSCEFTEAELNQLAPVVGDAPITADQIVRKAGFNHIESGDGTAAAKALRTAARMAECLDELDTLSLCSIVTTKLQERKVRYAARMVNEAFGIKKKSTNYPPDSTATLQHPSANHATEKELEVLRQRCSQLETERNILDKVVEVMRGLCIAGEERLIKLSYLVITARVLDRPASLIIKGPSSAGKSYPVQMLLKLFPASAYYALTGMSEHALVYLTEPMSHRTLIIYEATGFESDEHSYFLRSLLSEGKLSYQTNEKGGDGKIQSRLVTLEGPTGLITTTTAVNLHPENETRALSVLANDSPEQTRAVMLAQAREPVDMPDTTPFVALQEWLIHAEHRVTIPFAEKLANLIPPVAVRLRRDFATILNLVRANAVLHQATRNKDSLGRIIAGLEDYEVVRQLVSEAIGSQVDATVPETVRQTVDAVARVYVKTRQPVSISELKGPLKLDKSTISRRVKSALRLDYLQNEEKHRGRSYKLIPGDPLPAAIEILPSKDDLQSGAEDCTVDCNNHPIDNIGDIGKCCSVARQTECLPTISVIKPRPLSLTAAVPEEEPIGDRMAGVRRNLKAIAQNRGIEICSNAPPCRTCKGIEQWRIVGGDWRCATCHPNPNGYSGTGSVIWAE